MATSGESIEIAAIRPRTVTVRSGEQVWQLRDQVPSETLLQVFDLYALDEQMRALGTPTDLAGAQALRELYEALFARTTEILTDIWRCTYPEATADEVKAAIPAYADRRRIVEGFFGLQWSGSSAPSSASSNGASASQTPTPPTTTTNSAAQETTTTLRETTGPNRATRRATARAANRSTS